MRPLALCTLACAIIPAAALAQQPASPAESPVALDSTRRVRVDIPAQPLAGALAALRRQAGLALEVRGVIDPALRAPAVSGEMTVAAALRALLAGSGYTARRTASLGVLVARGAEGDSAARTLAPVVVVRSGTSQAGYGARRSTTATKTDTPLRDVPQAVTVVTRDLIADQAMRGMADVVRYVPGVTMGQGEGHRDAPTIRGNSSTADFFVDGVRDDAQYLRDLYNVERVEALKGSNAMVFGRGGGGGVINRVNKEAQWAPVRSLSVAGGSFDQKRGSVDVGQGLGDAVAVRLNGMYERSGGFRDAYRLERFGVNPTLAIAAGARTSVRLGYEYFSDERLVDRGVPSFQGRPAAVPITTFFGNPDANGSDARVQSASATVEHGTSGGVTIRNRTRFADYDKFYSNSFPGAVNAAGTQVNLSAYDNATDRRNLFNQTDVTYGVATGPVQHTLLVGAEVGRQRTENFRQTGYFNNTAASFAVPLDAPTVATPITFRQSATDADNRSTTQVAAVYAQNQLALSSHWQAVLGLRYERFAIDYRNNRDGAELERTDALLSPRAGLVFKPAEPLSFYGGYSVSYLPSAGDQFTALTVTSQTLEPEQFRNYEVGAKWDARADLALTAAAYRLDRENTVAPDPTQPTGFVQTGSQRTTGYELGVTGRITPAWQVAGGVASQRATITSTTTAAKAGATVPLVPRTTVSFWNKYQILPELGLGVGVVHQTRMYTAIDNAVTQPAFTRLDGGLYVALTSAVRAQLNVENLLDRSYYATSHSNNNIMPGASRTVRLSLTATP